MHNSCITIVGRIILLLVLGMGPLYAQDAGQDSTSTAESSSRETTQSGEQESSPTEPPPKFVPNEKISPDTVIAFPADI